MAGDDVDYDGVNGDGGEDDDGGGGGNEYYESDGDERAGVDAFSDRARGGGGREFVYIETPQQQFDVNYDRIKARVLESIEVDDPRRDFRYPEPRTVFDRTERANMEPLTTVLTFYVRGLLDTNRSLSLGKAIEQTISFANENVAGLVRVGKYERPFEMPSRYALYRYYKRIHSSGAPLDRARQDDD